MGELTRLACEFSGRHIPINIDPTGGDPDIGGPVYITICERCGVELAMSREAIILNNHIAFEKEATMTSGIRRCKHFMDGDQIPCPPECPRQNWPEYLFKRTFWRRRWVLKEG